MSELVCVSKRECQLCSITRLCSLSTTRMNSFCTVFSFTRLSDLLTVSVQMGLQELSPANVSYTTVVVL